MRLGLCFALRAGLLGILLASGDVRAAAGGDPAAGPADTPRRYCTATTCGPRRATPVATAAAFGAAVLLTGLAARRSPPPRS